MLRFLLLRQGSRVKSSLACHRTCFFECCAAFFFFFLAIVGSCKGQSAGSTASPSASKATAIYKLGLADLQKGDLDSARAAFEEVVRLAPQSPEGHNSLGWVLLAEGEVDSAIKQFESALKLKPDFVQARINFANALIRKGDLAGALRERSEERRVGKECRSRW